MVSLKGIIKFSLGIFIMGWMFWLGIMVERGTSPVKFDTQKFQKRLEAIIEQTGKEKVSGIEKKGGIEDEQEEPPREIDLKFYDVLDSPVPEESLPPQKKPLEIIPKKEIEIPEVSKRVTRQKTSKKRETYKKKGKKTKAKPPLKTDTKKEAAKTVAKDEKKEYTIQIAAFKEVSDADRQMAALKKKGFASYRVKGEKNNATWYRVRTGFFATLADARKYREKLTKANIQSMIIKKGSE